MITVAWYRKYEHGTRVGLWASVTGGSQIVGGLIAYGCVVGEAKHPTAGFSSWKIYGACMLYFMAGSIVTAKFLY
jgi:ACS family allantoate permease-like MFS transporter